MTGYKQSSHGSDPALLTPLSIVLVLAAAFLHASWNALLRGGADRTQSMAIMNATLGFVGVVLLLISGLPATASWVYVVASGVLHWIYVALLVVTYRSGDLGETYPVARGSSPALVALGGSLLAGEWMNLLGIVGVGLVCVGIFMLAAAKGRLRAHEPSGGAGDRSQHCRLYRCRWPRCARLRKLAWLHGGDLCVLHRCAAVVSGEIGQFAFFNAAAGEVGKAASGGLISLAAYGAIIWAMQGNAMGAVSALRETSVVFAALLGAVFLDERLTGLRIAACCIIAAGAACVGWRS